MDLIGTVLPLALVVGLSPLPVLPAVLLLMSRRPRPNAVAYLGAWLATLTLVVAVAVALTGSADPGPVSDEGVGWLQVATGTLFLALAAVKALRRRRSGPAKEQPAWMTALDSYSPRQSARLGAALAGANPKNLVMALAAGTELAVLGQDLGQVLAGIVGFVVVGSLGVATPVVAYLLLGDRASPALLRGKGWLERHSDALSIGVLVILGVLLVAKGLP